MSDDSPLWLLIPAALFIGLLVVVYIEETRREREMGLDEDNP